MFVKTIASFNDIQLKISRPLVICDIDETILHFNPTIDQTKSNQCNQPIKIIYEPTHTDLDGFIELTKRINELKGKLIFLTARKKEDESYTRNNFKSIGLNYDDYKVYYTNNKISKGEYIYNYIQTSDYDNIIFIDDRADYINSVLDYMPYVDCYLFYISNAYS
uniref:FCP1 homology domain-containing protein n=1 Tax=viral metagenome TaxID=1070528 RepID=A0A6C0ITH1_9ZZZZ